jgi:hypothetical protein
MATDRYRIDFAKTPHPSNRQLPRSIAVFFRENTGRGFDVQHEWPAYAGALGKPVGADRIQQSLIIDCS